MYKLGHCTYLGVDMCADMGIEMGIGMGIRMGIDMGIVCVWISYAHVYRHGTFMFIDVCTGMCIHGCIGTTDDFPWHPSNLKPFCG